MCQSVGWATEWRLTNVDLLICRKCAEYLMQLAIKTITFSNFANDSVFVWVCFHKELRSVSVIVMIQSMLYRFVWNKLLFQWFIWSILSWKVQHNIIIQYQAWLLHVQCVQCNQDITIWFVLNSHSSLHPISFSSHTWSNSIAPNQTMLWGFVHWILHSLSCWYFLLLLVIIPQQTTKFMCSK